MSVGASNGGQYTSTQLFLTPTDDGGAGIGTFIANFANNKFNVRFNPDTGVTDAEVSAYSELMYTDLDFFNTPPDVVIGRVTENVGISLYNAVNGNRSNKTEFDLIKRYREMALHPETDSAIEDIVNEAIVSDSNDSPVEIELSNLNASDGIKNKIRKEFKYILDLLDFDKKAHEIYRNWYVDGRLYYHKIIDLKNPHEGIQELRYIDAMKMRYIRKQKKKKEDRLSQAQRPVSYTHLTLPTNREV